MPAPQLWSEVGGHLHRARDAPDDESQVFHLVSRNRARLQAFTEDLAADGIEADGFDADFGDRDVLPAVVAAEFPLDLLLRTPVTLIRQLLPGMIKRGDGAVLFGLPVSASIPVPRLGNVGPAAAAARHYLHNLHADLAGTGVYAGLVQVAGLVGDSDAAGFVAQNWDPATLPGAFTDLPGTVDYHDAGVRQRLNSHPLSMAREQAPRRSTAVRLHPS
jgi:hypothetical protein